MKGLHRGLAALLLALLASGSFAAPESFWRRPERLLNEQGQWVTLAQYAGRPTIVAMEYSACRFVCTVNWRKLVELQDEADRQHRELQVLIVSIDPEHDTPALWREYRQVRGLSRSNWSFLTAPRAETDAIARWLGIQWWRYGDAIMHNFRIIRLDPAGRQLKAMEAFDVTASDFLRD